MKCFVFLPTIKRLSLRYFEEILDRMDNVEQNEFKLDLVLWCNDLIDLCNKHSLEYLDYVEKQLSDYEIVWVDEESPQQSAFVIDCKNGEHPEIKTEKITPFPLWIIENV